MVTERDKALYYLRFGEPGRYVWRDENLRCIETIDNHSYTTMPMCRLYFNWCDDDKTGAYLGEAPIEEAIGFLFGDEYWFIEYIPHEDAYRIFDPDAPANTIAYVDDIATARKEAQDEGRELVEMM